MSKIRIFVLILSLISLLVPTTVLAKGEYEDKVVLGGTFTLESEEIHQGNLVVFGGAVTLERSSTVHGDVVLIGGTVEVGGKVNGSVVGIGGAVRLKEGADIIGDLITLGAALRREEGSSVRGQIINGLDIPNIGAFPDEFNLDDMNTSNQSNITFDAGPILEMIWFFFRIFMYAALAVVIMLFIPKHIDRIAKAAINQPVITAGAGLLTAVLAPLALIAITITIILIPVTIVAIIVLFAAWLIGWIALGTELGRRIAQTLNMDWAPAISAGLGTFFLFLIFGGFRQLIPCIGLLPHFLISIWGLGAVVMTRFGTQDYGLILHENEISEGFSDEEISDTIVDHDEEEVDEIKDGVNEDEDETAS